MKARPHKKGSAGPTSLILVVLTNFTWMTKRPHEPLAGLYISIPPFVPDIGLRSDFLHISPELLGSHEAQS